jgi:hypothetical protein
VPPRRPSEEEGGGTCGTGGEEERRGAGREKERRRGAASELAVTRRTGQGKGTAGRARGERGEGRCAASGWSGVTSGRLLLVTI